MIHPAPINADFSGKALGPLYIRIADISTSIISDSDGPQLRLDPTARLFLADDQSTDVTVRASWRAKLLQPAAERVFDSGALWQLFRDGERHTFSFTSPKYGRSPYKIAHFDSRFESGEVYLSREYFAVDEQLYPLEYPLDELIMMNLLAAGRGVEVHSSGIITPDGQGLLFAGQSGAGKTTISRLWQLETGAEILSDDRIIIRMQNGQFWMYGTPWHGEAALASSRRAPLSAIFFLCQAQKNEIKNQSHAVTAARLLACGFPPFYNPAGLDFTLGFYDDLTRSIPCVELGFVPDRTAIDCVRSFAEQGRL
jgi:hypothetical protein